ncbi:hypothetical protein MY4038_008400 [Beauveria bassiana]
MVAQTRSQTAGNQQTKTKEQKTKQRENNGIPKKEDSDKASKTLAKTLNAAVDAYEKADDDKKAEMQNQLNVRQPMDKPDAMDEDDEEPAGGQDVKKESEEGSMFVPPISNDQDHSPEKSKGSPSGPKPSSDKEQDSKPPSDNSHGKPPPPKVDFQNGLATPSTEDELDLVRANPVRELFHDGASENIQATKR